MRERHQHVEPETSTAHAGPAGGPDRTELREEGVALLAAADDAIARALSGNSAEFLAQNRQAGGE